MKQGMLFAAIYEALTPERCVVCRLTLGSVHRMLDTFLYEHVNDPWIRLRLVGASGFCPAHAWQVHGFKSPLGTAIVYHHLLQEFLTIFREAGPSRPVGSSDKSRPLWSARQGTLLERSIISWLQPQRICPVCETQREAEQRYIASVAHALDDGDFRQRYGQALGVCVRHAPAVLAQTPQPSDTEWFAETELLIMQRLLWELNEFIRKHDYRFTQEPRGEEQTSWVRVIEKLGGAPGMVWRS